MSDSRNKRESTDGGDSRARIVRALVALVIILVLLLCCWTLLWPVPESSVDGGAEFERGSASGGGLTVRNVRSSVPSATVSSRKGANTVVTFEVTATDANVAFDVEFITLQLDAVLLPPLQDAEFRRWTQVPKMLRAGEPEEVSVVFGVPRGSMDATLTVRTSLLSDSRAPHVPITFGTKDHK